MRFYVVEGYNRDGELDYSTVSPVREPTSCATVRSEQKFLTAPSKLSSLLIRAGGEGGPKVF